MSNFICERYWPRNSGFGPERELLHVLVYLPVGLLLLTLVAGVARSIAMGPLASKRHAFTLGAICGSYHAHVMLWRLGLRFDEVAFLVLIVAGALLLRINLARTPNARVP